MKNEPHFHEGPDGEALIEMWKKHSERALPRNFRFFSSWGYWVLRGCLERIAKTTAVIPDIPLNAEGIPVFPRMDLIQTPLAGVLSVLQEFIHQLWSM